MRLNAAGFLFDTGEPGAPKSAGASNRKRSCDHSLLERRRIHVHQPTAGDGSDLYTAVHVDPNVELADLQTDWVWACRTHARHGVPARLRRIHGCSCARAAGQLGLPVSEGALRQVELLRHVDAVTRVCAQLPRFNESNVLVLSILMCVRSFVKSRSRVLERCFETRKLAIDTGNLCHARNNKQLVPNPLPYSAFDFVLACLARATASCASRSQQRALDSDDAQDDQESKSRQATEASVAMDFDLRGSQARNIHVFAAVHGARLQAAARSGTSTRLWKLQLNAN